MKKMISLLLFIGTIHFAFAQNVGIGVLNPTYKLHVGNETNGVRIEGPTIAGGNVLSIGGLGNIMIDKPGSAGGRFSILENGNVGIGEPNPGFPLNFASNLGEKISFYGTSGSNYGIGVQGGLLQIHANVATDDIGFGTGSSASFAENMRIKGNGNVGIGTITPQGYGHGGNNKILEIKNPNNSVNSQAQLVLSTSATDGSMGGVTWAQNNVLSNAMAAFLGCALDPFGISGSRLVFYTRSSAPANLLTEKMTINGNGHVGIGTSSPNAPLQFASNIANRKVVLFDVNNDDNQYYGFGINGGALRYQVSNTVSDHVFYAGTSSSTSNELLRLKGNGAIAVNGNTGTAGQVLTSNGSGSAPAWKYPMQEAWSSSANNSFGELQTITSGFDETLTGFFTTITTTAPSTRLLISYNVMINPFGCTGLGCTAKGGINLYVDGFVINSKEFNLSLSPAFLSISLANFSKDVPPGNHSVLVRCSKGSSAVNSYEVFKQSFTVIAVPQ